MSDTLRDGGHFDVLIAGAGISGIAAAYHMTKQADGFAFLVLEAQHSFGGTWLTHRYPGVRSDSDLYTFGYRFKPWTGAPIAGADEIRSYMQSVIEDAGLDAHIRYDHKIVKACWSSAREIWTVDVHHVQSRETVRFTTGFLWMCQGYYRHDEGYVPTWPGMQKFLGRIVHPQRWPSDLDVTGKRVVVVGSGATAATLIPNIANRCAHVTMLQRSPTYFAHGRNVNDLADTLRALAIDENWIHEIVRRQILTEEAQFARRSLDEPEAVRNELLSHVSQIVGPEVTEQHFSPRYRPWRQRLAFVPDADLFHSIKSGKVTVETDEIQEFSECGLLLKSGKRIDADIIVTATGFNLSVMGDIQFVVDEAPVDFSATLTYRGMMFSGVPNLVYVFGYLRSSWTLRADLVADFTCRLIGHMHLRDSRKVQVVPRQEHLAEERVPWIQPENFNPGYLLRSLHLLPKALKQSEWRHSQDYAQDQMSFPAINLDAPEFVYDDGRPGFQADSVHDTVSHAKCTGE